MVQKSKVIRLAEEKVDLVDYFNKYATGTITINNHTQTVQNIKLGGSAICPLHAETDASFKVYQKNGITLFHCFGCGAGGTVVDLYRRLEVQKRGMALSKDEAAANLLKLYGYEEIAEEAITDVDPLKVALTKVRGYTSVNINKTFNFPMFRQQNKKIIKIENNIAKIRQFAEIDRMIAAYVAISNTEVGD